MRITAKADYAVRAAAELAAASPSGGSVKGETLAVAQGIPRKFLENILADLRRAGLVRTRRGAEGGYALTRLPTEISIADVLRAVEGPLAAVQGIRPEALRYGGAASRLPEVWVALRANVRAVLERVTLADLAHGEIPRPVGDLTTPAAAWEPH